MDIFSLLIGVSASIIAVLLGVMTLGGRVTRWLKRIVRDVEMETGLIRYSRFEKQPEWPNGWANLPDSLEGINDKIEGINDKLEAHFTNHP